MSELFLLEQDVENLCLALHHVQVAINKQKVFLLQLDHLTLEEQNEEFEVQAKLFRIYAHIEDQIK